MAVVGALPAPADPWMLGREGFEVSDFSHQPVFLTTNEKAELISLLSVNFFFKS